MSLNHKFHLVSLDDFSYEEYWKVGDHQVGISLHDDQLGYMSDSLRWIKTYNPSKNEPHQGLCWYGPTLIRLEGAMVTAKIFEAWANLFTIGPETLNLRGYYMFDDEHEEGYYSRLEVPRDELVQKLRTIAAYAQTIVDSDGKHFVLHLGI